MSRCALRFVALTMLLLPAAALDAQTPPPDSPAAPAIRRWLDVQALTLYTRYRLTEANTGVVNTNDLQYKEAVRARVNIDARQRYTLNVGAFSGSTFISSWDNTGIGRGVGDGHSHYVKQLYVAAVPVTGLELQYGGLYLVKGETTDFTSYDDDGYVVGERLSLRRPREAYFDEVSVTRARLGPPETPNLMRRWDGLHRPNYAQVLVAKRLTPVVSASADYTTYAGSDTIRGALSFRFKPRAPLSALRYEQYVRVNTPSRAGFALAAERAVLKRVRLQGGYVTVDQAYGNLNADRIQRGRRFFAVANVSLAGPFTAQLFATQALHSSYPVSNRTRFDAVLQYDLLATLRERIGI